MKANSDIRWTIQDSDLKQWQVAEKLGVSEGYFSRMMRKELSPEKKLEIMGAIKELKKGD